MNGEHTKPVELPSEEERLTDTAKALGEICAYPRNEQGMPGISLRMLYAGMAMQGLLAGCASNYDAVAEGAVRQADALLKELAK